jgi:uncharacterized protein YbjT (DUF2867 family)
VILVTAATGTVGRAVFQSLAGAGVSARAGVRNPQAFLAAHPSADAVALDFDQLETFGPALQGASAVFLLTPLHEQMPAWVGNLVAAAEEAGVRRIVRLSAMGADWQPAITLGRVHRAAERAIEQSGLDYTILRPNAFMQNYVNHFGATIRADGAFYLPQGGGRVSVIDVRDIAAVATRVLVGCEHEGKTYELTGGEALSNYDIAAILSETLGRPIRYVDVAEQVADAALARQGMSPWQSRVIMELYAVSRADVAATVSTHVRELLGRPPTGIRRFVADHAAGLR